MTLVIYCVQKIYVIFIANVKKCETAKAIICDEVHNAGAPTWQKGLIEDFDCRIALSATPKRYFDDEGSNLIDSYFNGIVIERDLKWGIENNFLSPYNYHISLVELDEDELIEYREITSKMMKYYDKDKQFQSKPFMIKANERAKIIKTASSKYLAFENLIKKLDYDLNGGFIFCGSTPFLNNIQSIMKKNDIKYRIFISDSKTEDRKDIIKRFKVHRLDAIVAIDCLDEGIDIPGQSKRETEHRKMEHASRHRCGDRLALVVLEEVSAGCELLVGLAFRTGYPLD